MMPSTARACGAVLVGMAALLAGGSAHAYCRTSTTSSPTHDGHVCTPAKSDDSGLPIYWGRPRITYSVQKDASADVTFGATRTAVRAAFDTWMAVDCGDGPPRIEVTEGDPAVCARQEYNKERANANVIYFVDDGWADAPSALALTIVTFNVDTGEIYDADMALNSTYFKFTTGDTMVGSDLLSVLTHETGHFLGLAHSPVPDATMNLAYTPGSTTLRDLAQDDRDGICDIYPPAPIASECDATPRHGFSAECAANQPAPDPGAGKAASPLCCCTDGYRCEDGVCSMVSGCGCEVWSRGGEGGSRGLAGTSVLCAAAALAAFVRTRRSRRG